MYCIKCGEKNDDNTYFCKKCGYNLRLEDNIRENNRLKEKEYELRKMKYAKIFTIATIICASISLLLFLLSFLINTLVPGIIFVVLSIIMSLIAMFGFNSTRLNFIPGFLPILFIPIFILIQNQSFSSFHDKNLLDSDWKCTSNNYKGVIDVDIDMKSNDIEIGDDDSYEFYLKGKIAGFNELRDKKDGDYELVVDTYTMIRNGVAISPESRVYVVKIKNKHNIVLSDKENNAEFNCMID